MVRSLPKERLIMPATRSNRTNIRVIASEAHARRLIAHLMTLRLRAYISFYCHNGLFYIDVPDRIHLDVIKEKLTDIEYTFV